MEIQRVINMRDREEESSLPPFTVTVIVDEENFTITDMNGAWIFRAPLEVLVIQMCMMEPDLAQYIMPPWTSGWSNGALLTEIDELLDTMEELTEQINALPWWRWIKRYRLQGIYLTDHRRLTDLSLELGKGGE